MSYFHTCEECGANLDPGEHCDCKEVRQNENGISRWPLAYQRDDR